MVKNSKIYFILFLLNLIFFSCLLVFKINQVTLENISTSIFLIYIISIVGMPSLIYNKIILNSIEKNNNLCTYICSNQSIPEISNYFRKLRDIDGFAIVSTLINNIKNDDLSYIAKEIKKSERVIVYVEPNNFLLKGYLIEIGIAIGYNIPVYIVSNNINFDADLLENLSKYPLIKFLNSIEEALIGSVKQKK